MVHDDQGEAHTNIAVVGPASSGKTTLVKRIIGQNPSMSTPTIGFDVKTVNYRGIKIFITDLGGQKPFVINFWEKMLSTADGVIFVIDAAAPNKFILAYDLFLFVLKKMNNVPMIVLANKQDLPDAASVEELEQIFNFEKARMRFGITSLNIFPVSALRGDGVTEALDHLWSQMVLRTAGKLPLINDIFVYQRTTGRPVALARMTRPAPGEDSSIQVKDPSLISAFYAALTTFSKEFVTSPVQSLRLRNPSPTSPDYYLFNYSDPKSNLSCLIITSGESNEVLEEFLAERIISHLKREYPWMTDEDTNNRSYIDITPTILEIMEMFRTSSGSMVDITPPDLQEPIDDDFLWTKVLLADEQVQSAMQKESQDTSTSRDVDAIVNQSLNVVETNLSLSKEEIDSTVPFKLVLQESKPVEKSTTSMDDINQPNSLLSSNNQVGSFETKIAIQGASSDVTSQKPPQKITQRDEMTLDEINRGKETVEDRKKMVNESRLSPEVQDDVDDDDEYYKKFRQLSILERVRELEKRRRSKRLT